jgi:hypothetical protein
MALQNSVRHMVFFSFHQNATPDQIRTLIFNFLALKDKIPGIISFETGVNNSPEGLNQGLTHAFVLTFDNLQSRDRYLPHPEHQRFVKENLSIVDKVMVIDYTPEE